MTDNKSALLQEVLDLFESLGVKEGAGRDGMLMQRIRVELATGSNDVVSFDTPGGKCPLCGAADMTLCDCPPDEQLNAL